MEPQPITLDLFAGAGGITEGFRQAGFSCVFANDIMPEAAETFRLNHPDVAFASESVELLDPRRVRRALGLGRGDLDCLVGGPPCQGFSINAPERFLEDPRNLLFRRSLDFIREFQPKTVMIENVPGMLSLGEGAVVRRIIQELNDAEYDTRLGILLAAHYGVPQQRWRLIILGSRVGPAPRHPQPTHHAVARPNFAGGRSLTFKTAPDMLLARHVSVRDALGDLPELEVGGGVESRPYESRPHSKYATQMRRGASRLTHHVAPRIDAVNIERLKHVPPGGSWRDIPFELLPAGMKKARRSDHTKRYGRLDPDGLAATVMTKMDPHWGPAFHYSQDRTLTVREAARLQSFPDRYIFSGTRAAQYTQVGNAVPVLMARAIASSVGEALGLNLDNRVGSQAS